MSLNSQSCSDTFLWAEPKNPSLVKKGPFDKLQVKVNKSATALTVFFYVRCVESAVLHAFSVKHISLFSLH